MPGKSDTDPKKVLEKIRAASYADAVTAKMLQSVYALEHEKQFEDERSTVEAALRELIADGVEEQSWS
jgi:protein-L-isoaspartate O-methyltransferase